MKIIEEIYFGNLRPNGAIQPNHSCHKAMKTLNTNEELLCKLLEGKERKIFHDYANAWSTVNGTDSVENFILGFKLGAKLIAETLGDDDPSYLRE